MPYSEGVLRAKCPSGSSLVGHALWQGRGLAFCSTEKRRRETRFLNVSLRSGPCFLAIGFCQQRVWPTGTLFTIRNISLTVVRTARQQIQYPLYVACNEHWAEKPSTFPDDETAGVYQGIPVENPWSCKKFCLILIVTSCPLPVTLEE